MEKFRLGRSDGWTRAQDGAGESGEGKERGGPRLPRGETQSKMRKNVSTAL